MFVTADHFNIRPYKLPNLDNAAIKAEFEEFVEDWESEWLPKIFGSSFYAKFVEDVSLLPSEWDADEQYVIGNNVVEGVNVFTAVNDNLNSPPTTINPDWQFVEENRWLKIIKGSSYKLEANGLTYKWVGLITAEKYAIFSSWLKASIHDVSGVSGNVTADVENSTVESSAQTIATAWNKFARLIGGRTKWDKFDTLYGYLIVTGSTGGTFDDTFDETFETFIVFMNREFGWPGRLNQFNL